MAWGNRQKLANRAWVEGDLDLAARYLRREGFQTSTGGRRLSRQVTAALVQRAEQATSSGNLTMAWKDLSTASELAGPKESDQIARQKNQLVEMTIESADSLLFQAQVTHAVQLVDQLGKRMIMDWRADRIRNVAHCLQTAEDLAAFGKFTDSIQQLEQAKNIQPDLPFLESRLAAAQQREIQLKQLTAELQASALKCLWSDVAKCCQKILLIAPKHQIALDAQKHCLSRIKRKTSAGVRATNVPVKSNASAANSFFQINQSNASSLAADPASKETTVENSRDSFLLWVDGVGGYLVCTDKVNTIGQAIPLATIAIPIQGDLRRRHARLESVGGQHLIHPLGPVMVDGQTLKGAAELKHQQIIALDGGVQLKYLQPHPLSKSGRLDFVSRHRTCPWSDAILLASQSIVLGPNRDNHVFCPTWSSDLILFERSGKWYCRAKAAFEVDGVHATTETEINFDSRIVGEDYSLTLEPIVVQPDK